MVGFATNASEYYYRVVHSGSFVVSACGRGYVRGFLDKRKRCNIGDSILVFGKKIPQSKQRALDVLVLPHRTWMMYGDSSPSIASTILTEGAQDT